MVCLCVNTNRCQILDTNILKTGTHSVLLKVRFEESVVQSMPGARFRYPDISQWRANGVARRCGGLPSRQRCQSGQPPSDAVCVQDGISPRQRPHQLTPVHRPVGCGFWFYSPRHTFWLLQILPSRAFRPRLGPIHHRYVDRCRRTSNCRFCKRSQLNVRHTPQLPGNRML